MSADDLLKTPLHALHLERGARMVPFAGYSMPVQYPGGLMAEHLHCRTSASLFDVSHMGQLRLTGEGAAAALESVIPIDVLGLPPGQQRYGFFTNEHAGILDDLMLTHHAADGRSEWLLVVNAAGREADAAHLMRHIGDRCHIEPRPDLALLALQGPQAVVALSRLDPTAQALGFMTGAALRLLGTDCFVTRSGYTGEDGFEISVPASHADALARALLEQPEVQPGGLGARDTLRLEAGLCLHGSDIDATTTPDRGGPRLGHPEGATARRRARRRLSGRIDRGAATGRGLGASTRRSGGAGPHAGACRHTDLRDQR